MYFNHKTIVITGASKGLGAEIAKQLSAESVNLVLFARTKTPLEATAAACRAQGAQVLCVVGDITQPQDCKRLVDESLAAFGQIDVFINNAGVSMWAKFSDIEDLDLFDSLMQVNYLGPVYCTHYARPTILENKGSIVNISSVQGRFGVPCHTGYAAAKHALQGFFDSLRIEEPDLNILMVYPAWISGTKLRQSAFAATGKSVKRKAKKHSKSDLTSEYCASQIIKAIARGSKSLTLPRRYRVLFILRAVASRLLQWIIKKKFKAKSNQAD
jgi:short-subunit dehydrogenase